MFTVVNVAFPPEAVTVVVPRRLAPALPVPVVIASDTWPPKFAVLPSESSAVTVSGVIGLPATVLAGGPAVNTSRFGGPATTVNDGLGGCELMTPEVAWNV